MTCKNCTIYVWSADVTNNDLANFLNYDYEHLIAHKSAHLFVIKSQFEEKYLIETMSERISRQGIKFGISNDICDVPSPLLLEFVTEGDYCANATDLQEVITMLSMHFLDYYKRSQEVINAAAKAINKVEKMVSR